MMTEFHVYGLFDEDGFSEGFWASDVHGIQGEEGSKVPANAIEITRNQWDDLLYSSGTKKYVNGEVVTADPPRPGPEMGPEPKAMESRDLLAEIDQLKAEMEELKASIAK